MIYKKSWKYILIRDDCNNHRLGYRYYRLKAVKDFSDVTKWNLGGYLCGYHNLSQKGDCWIYDNAKVHFKAFIYDNAIVKDNATVGGSAQIYGNAIVEGKVWIHDNAKVYEDAVVTGCAEISGRTKVFGNQVISGNRFIQSTYDI